jgi:hypothetical protein
MAADKSSKNEVLLGDLRGGMCSSGLCKQLRGVAADEIERLTRELAEAHRIFASIERLPDETTAPREDVSAQDDPMSLVLTDAARYRWLRVRGVAIDQTESQKRGFVRRCCNLDEEVDHLRAAELRPAVKIEARHLTASEERSFSAAFARSPRRVETFGRPVPPHRSGGGLPVSMPERPIEPTPPASDNCEHGIPRRFCTAVHAEKAGERTP